MKIPVAEPAAEMYSIPAESAVLTSTDCDASHPVPGGVSTTSATQVEKPGLASSLPVYHAEGIQATIVVNESVHPASPINATQEPNGLSEPEAGEEAAAESDDVFNQLKGLHAEGEMDKPEEYEMSLPPPVTPLPISTSTQGLLSDETKSPSTAIRGAASDEQVTSAAIDAPKVNAPSPIKSRMASEHAAVPETPYASPNTPKSVDTAVTQPTKIAPESVAPGNGTAAQQRLPTLYKLVLPPVYSVPQPKPSLGILSSKWASTKPDKKNNRKSGGRY